MFSIVSNLFLILLNMLSKTTWKDSINIRIN
jgi:hypothetical protein